MKKELKLKIDPTSKIVVNKKDLSYQEIINMAINIQLTLRTYIYKYIREMKEVYPTFGDNYKLSVIGDSRFGLDRPDKESIQEIIADICTDYYNDYFTPVYLHLFIDEDNDFGYKIYTDRNLIADIENYELLDL